MNEKLVKPSRNVGIATSLVCPSILPYLWNDIKEIPLANEVFHSITKGIPYNASSVLLRGKKHCVEVTSLYTIDVLKALLWKR